MYLPMWGVLQPPFLEQNPTGAEMGWTQSVWPKKRREDDCLLHRLGRCEIGPDAITILCTGHYRSFEHSIKYWSLKMHYSHALGSIHCGRMLSFNGILSERKLWLCWMKLSAMLLLGWDYENKDGTRHIAMTVDTTFVGWGAISTQEDPNHHWPTSYYKSRCSNRSLQTDDAGIPECAGLRRALKTALNNVYAFRLLRETDAKNIVHQIQLPPNNLPPALDTYQILCVTMFDINMDIVPGCMNASFDGLWQWPQCNANFI